MATAGILLSNIFHRTGHHGTSIRLASRLNPDSPLLPLAR
jgi:hypothetical protein